MKTIIDEVKDFPEIIKQDGFNSVESRALALLLLNEVLIINNWHWKDWTKEAKNKFAITVSCSDTFAYACADTEDLDFDNLQDLYEHFVKDEIYGPLVWCMKKRNEKSLKGLYDKIQSIGIFNLDEMNLKPNSYEEYMKNTKFLNKE